MSINAIPEKIVNYNAYLDNDKLIGLNTDVTLPKLEQMTSTVSGAGIAGEYESTVPGHFGKIEIDVTFNTVTEQSAELLIPGAKTLVFRASQQSYDVASGASKFRPLKVTTKILSKGVDLGKLTVGKQTGTKNTFEVIYLKVEENGKELIELDKLNFVFKVNGVDVLAAIRNQI
ncbi:phage major tail tube protein [Clostridium chromiireducens]|uniref:Phage tail tube protein FII n=1 Tax=Clostridium chromiireducens TaxID=225345 RepID=A0A1V4IUS9_9CLOT|nr:phage major tail tube protein [Clostridium chromiireducens]OPJ63686.1 phage tail tube protein FII [Clostridium chromiireducens]